MNGFIMSWLAAWILIPLAQLCLACPPPEYYARRTAINNASEGMDSEVAADLGKRWYSLPVRPKWAVVSGEQPYPWPVIPCNRERPAQWIYFCFADEQSTRSLLPVLLHAIAKWAPAFEYSALNIQPDPGCNGDYACLCGPATNPDVLRIQDPPGDEGFPRATEGYIYNSNEAGRHVLILPTEGVTTNAELWELVNTMAHELGHVIGLDHEHQRPDRDTFIKINAENIPGYEKAEELVRHADDPAFNQVGTNVDERMQLVCSEGSLAMKYWPDALAYVRGNTIPRWRNNRHGHPFDFASIMIYSSTETDEPQRWRLQRRVWDPVGLNGLVIWEGGAKHYQQRSISVQDIKRVAALYPGTVQQQRAAAEKLQQWSPMAVTVGHFTTTVRPAPVDTGPPGGFFAGGGV